ncbi:MAG: dodecin [bacterium]
MADKTYKKVEVVGTSENSVSEAIQNAIDSAAESLDNLDWFETSEIRGRIENGNPTYQVSVKIGFRLE